jgi:hypothetical protein
VCLSETQYQVWAPAVHTRAPCKLENADCSPVLPNHTDHEGEGVIFLTGKRDFSHYQSIQTTAKTHPAFMTGNIAVAWEFQTVNSVLKKGNCVVGIVSVVCVTYITCGHIWWSVRWTVLSCWIKRLCDRIISNSRRNTVLLLKQKWLRVALSDDKKVCEMVLIRSTD